MTKRIRTCGVGNSLASAAQALWERDCGCLPVVDDRGHVLGMITDRDICMAAYTTGRTLHDLRVGDAMAAKVATVRPSETLLEAEVIMRAHGVRRLPVVDDENRLIGLLTCNDLLRWVDDGGQNGAAHHDAMHLVRTLATIGKSRAPEVKVPIVERAPSSPAGGPSTGPFGRAQPAPATAVNGPTRLAVVPSPPRT